MKETSSRRLNALSLSGLLVGPVLGSGIILLPPLALERVGDPAILAWGVTLVLMGIFAWITGALAIRYPGSDGLVGAVRVAFGMPLRNLCAWFLTIAVCFGPTAVLRTAERYLAPILPGLSGASGMISALLLALCAGVLLCNISFVGSLSFWASTFVAGILVAGGAYALATAPDTQILERTLDAAAAADPSSFGSLLLLLFWAIIGWEILGNYTPEIATPRRTVPRAVTLAFLAVAVIYGTAVGALQFAVPQHSGAPLTMAAILEPLFGTAAAPLLGILALLLCGCTYIMFVGGVARLLLAQGEEGHLPRLFARKNALGAPASAVLFLAACHGIVLFVQEQGLFSLEGAVEVANAFLICNAGLAVLAGAKLLPSPTAKVCSLLLAGAFFAIFAFSPKWVLLVVLLLVLGTVAAERRRETPAEAQAIR